MKRITLGLAVLVSLAVVEAASAATPTPAPFPGNKVNGVFVAALTVNGKSAVSPGAVNDQFAPGDTVVFRAFAIDTKAHKLLTKKIAKLTKRNKKYAKTSLRSFFVRIPLVDDQQFSYAKVPVGLDPRYRWAVSWKVPDLYPVGTVQFEVFAKMWNKQSGTFTQLPISLSQLTITTTPQLPFDSGPQNSGGSVSSSNIDVALFGDVVAGHSRPVACTQTNVFKQGEMVIPRAFGYQLSDGAVLSSDNVATASFSVPTSPTDSTPIVTTMNWGAHGPTGQKVEYWTGAWTIPAAYPVGDINVHMTFKTLGGKTGTLDYPITIIPGP
jgi:hypothetical protein